MVWIETWLIEFDWRWCNAADLVSQALFVNNFDKLLKLQCSINNINNKVNVQVNVYSIISLPLPLFARGIV